MAVPSLEILAKLFVQIVKYKANAVYKKIFDVVQNLINLSPLGRRRREFSSGMFHVQQM